MNAGNGGAGGTRSIDGHENASFARFIVAPPLNSFQLTLDTEVTDRRIGSKTRIPTPLLLEICDDDDDAKAAVRARARRLPPDGPCSATAARKATVASVAASGRAGPAAAKTNSHSAGRHSSSSPSLPLK